MHCLSMVRMRTQSVDKINQTTEMLKKNKENGAQIMREPTAKERLAEAEKRIVNKIVSSIEPLLGKKRQNNAKTGWEFFFELLQSKHDDDFYHDAFAQIGKSIYNDLAENQFTGFGVYMEILSPDICSQTTYLPRLHANYDWKIGTIDERKQGAVTVLLQLQATPRLNASMPRRFWASTNSAGH